MRTPDKKHRSRGHDGKFAEEGGAWDTAKHIAESGAHFMERASGILGTVVGGVSASGVNFLRYASREFYKGVFGKRKE